MSETHVPAQGTAPRAVEAKRGLGRGLDSLLPSAGGSNRAAAPLAGGEQVHQLGLEVIDHNPYQTRMFVKEDTLKELAASIAANGVLQPVVVRPTSAGRYDLIAGERRLQASKLAGKATIPAIVRQVSNEQAMEMTIIENLQREDLNPMEQAEAFQRLSTEFGLTQEQMAQRTGKDRATIANYLRLMKLAEGIRIDLRRELYSFGHAKAFMALVDPVLIETAARRIKEGSLSVRQTEDLVAQMLHGVDLHPHAEEARQRVVDPNVRQAEKQLESALGCRVRIRDRKGKGKIVIEYATLEDFDRVVEALAGK